MGRVARLPVLVIAGLVMAAAMLVPAIHAAVTGRGDIAAIFASASAVGLVAGAILALATEAPPAAAPSRGVLMTMIGVYAGLPLMAAVPFAAVQTDTGLFHAWWEMLSCLTTTGATLYDAALLPPSLHLWRATMGWLGGLFILIAAIALMAPLRVGGFEIMDRSTGADERFQRLKGAPTGAELRPGRDYAAHLADPAMRLLRWGGAILPLYLGLTLALWLGLMLAGESGFQALVRAMGTLSTSGVAARAGPVGQTGGVAAELIVAGFMLFALSRRTWPGGGELLASARLRDDPELRMAAGLILLVTVTLFFRPFLGAFEAVDPTGEPLPAADTLTGGLARAAAAAWGAAFTALSYLTTTGWTSVHWDGARAWSGLSAPGLMLAGLAIMGGGVATAAGGVKLLRVHALAMHTRRELDRTVHPASIAGGGAIQRRLRGEGAYLAFIFFMLFALSIGVTIALVSLRPVAFETATILSVAALTNTGQLAEAIPLMAVFDGSAGIAGAPWQGWAGLSVLTKSVLAAAMVAGRIETLAILALLAPAGWRTGGRAGWLR
ncbi:TrkH family potassium uptake protein [Paracoccus endophyticus]|uniref:TrkH family potassium uptake protein n=1 Tax=Paracoccus endophyticus TaxID=2233774 RepID=UPI000DD54548|nr:TrkH family potassium uptake protein [Paracoccus endophyticus]